MKWRCKMSIRREESRPFNLTEHCYSEANYKHSQQQEENLNNCMWKYKMRMINIFPHFTSMVKSFSSKANTHFSRIQTKAFVYQVSGHDNIWTMNDKIKNFTRSILSHPILPNFEFTEKKIKRNTRYLISASVYLTQDVCSLCRYTSHSHFSLC